MICGTNNKKNRVHSEVREEYIQTMLVEVYITKSYYSLRSNISSTYREEGKVVPIHVIKAYWGSAHSQPQHSLEMSGQPYALATSPGKQPPVMHQIAGWVGSTAKFEVVEKRKIS